MAEGGIGAREKAQETAAEETSKTEEEVRNQLETENVRKILAERINGLNFAWFKGSPLDCFCGHGNDGLRLSWARGVNDSSALEEALKGAACIFEGDVSEFKRDRLRVPVMIRKPPYVGLEMKLDTWLHKVKKDGRRGVLLRFRDVRILETSLKLLRHARIQGPIILAADIFEAECLSPNPTPAWVFLKLCREYFPNAILCLGWTANIWGMIFGRKKYSDCCLDSMTKFLHEETVTTHVMFSMHALILQRSIEEAQELLRSFSNSSLYVWTDEDHPISIDDILTIRRSFDKTRVFYSLSKSQLDALQGLHADFSRSCYMTDFMKRM